MCVCVRLYLCVTSKCTHTHTPVRRQCGEGETLSCVPCSTEPAPLQSPEQARGGKRGERETV